jgi:hypothetical protein
LSHILLHIGYARAGSTYLQSWFTEHPDIYYQPLNIAGGFIHPNHLANFAEKTNKIPLHYVMSSEFITAWSGNVEYYGIEFNSEFDYLEYQSNMCQMLGKIFPNAKVLIVTRGYTTLFRSNYYKYISIGGTLTFKDIYSKLDFFISSYDYTKVINLYQTYFGKDNVLYIPFEKLQDNPKDFLKLVEDFIEIKTQYNYNSSKLNESLDSKSLVLIKRISKIIYVLLYPFPKNFRRKIYKTYIFFIQTKNVRSFLKWLSKFVRKSIEMKEEKEYIERMKGKAEILKDNPLYKPYLKEYLIEED